MSETAAITLKDITLRRHNRLLLDQVSAQLPTGTLTVVLGANGAGKSLLLRVMHGLIKPDSGEVLIQGQPLARRPVSQAMVFQQPVLLRRSVRGNLDYVLEGTARQRNARIDELLARVRLPVNPRQSARSLSGGEQQRLALARALALQPGLMFLDEPTANLDPASILLIEDIVTTLKQHSCKIVFVTHDLAQARRLADDIIFMHQGRILEHADSEAFFKAPASLAAKAYIDGELYV